jgi:hypothetical protein
MKENSKRTAEKLILLVFLLAILVPVILYLSAPVKAERITRLYFSGYMLMIAVIYYTVKLLKNSFSRQSTPLLEKYLVKSKEDTVLPAYFLNTVQQIEGARRRSRNFKHSIENRLAVILEHKIEGNPGVALPGVVIRLREIEKPEEEKERAGPFRRLRERFSEKGITIEEIERIIDALKKL